MGAVGIGEIRGMMRDDGWLGDGTRIFALTENATKSGENRSRVNRKYNSYIFKLDEKSAERWVF